MESERLLFKAQFIEDYEEILQMPQPEQLKALGLTDPDHLSAEIRRLERMVHEPQKYWSFWNLIDKATGRIAGNCLIHNISSRHKRAEIGYFLHEDYRGKGLMKEAVEVLLTYAFHDLGMNRMEACTALDNYASMAIIESMGFQKEGLLRGHYNTGSEFSDSFIFGLLKQDWEKLKVQNEK